MGWVKGRPQRQKEALDITLRNSLNRNVADENRGQNEFAGSKGRVLCRGQSPRKVYTAVPRRDTVGG